MFAKVWEGLGAEGQSWEAGLIHACCSEPHSYAQLIHDHLKQSGGGLRKTAQQAKELATQV